MMDLESTISYVTELFNGHVDKAGVPYINHVFAVYNTINSDREEDKIIALLHDVVEDTSVSLDDLRELGYSDYIVDGVEAITKIKGEKYSEYLDRVASHPGAKLAKIADLIHNSNLSRLDVITTKDLKRNLKYEKALSFLGV